MERRNDAAGPHDPDLGRRLVRQLDAWLQRLEDLHERDHLTVPAGLAAGLQAYIPAVQANMLITEAIDLVFQQQEIYLGPVLEGEVVGVGQPLEEQAARALTERIKTATRQVCMLLLEAHDGQAWSALGYKTWELYVRREFGLSRSRSYELLDQARVIRAVRSAAGLSGIPDISAYAAMQIKSNLSDVLTTIRARTAGLSGRRAMAVVEDVVREKRGQRVNRTNGQADSPEMSAETLGTVAYRDRPAISPAQLQAAICYLASMPPAAEVVRQLGEDMESQLTLLELALQWLTELAEACETRRSTSPPPEAAEDDESMPVAAG